MYWSLRRFAAVSGRSCGCTSCSTDALVRCAVQLAATQHYLCGNVSTVSRAGGKYPSSFSVAVFINWMSPVATSITQPSLAFYVSTAMWNSLPPAPCNSRLSLNTAQLKSDLFFGQQRTPSGAVVAFVCFWRRPIQMSRRPYTSSLIYVDTVRHQTDLSIALCYVKTCLLKVKFHHSDTARQDCLRRYKPDAVTNAQVTGSHSSDVRQIWKTSPCITSRRLPRNECDGEVAVMEFSLETATQCNFIAVKCPHF